MATTAKGKGGGVLSISVAATRKSHPSQAPAKSAQRAPAPRLRLIIRRLPPGLTEVEFWNALGAEWHVSKGKIDWAAYKDGKISKDPSKPSRPGRAYLKVNDHSILDSLSLIVKQTSFQDAKNTTKDSCLLGPPSLEFAPYSKMPSGRVRHDGRQGTIDQDQEFIDFLQSLTEPITKPGANGLDANDAPVEKVTTTPLVQYLKEKKANKAKEAAEKKSKAKQEGKEKEKEKDKEKEKETKPSKPESKSTVVIKGSTAAAEKARVAKATQDAVKAINKSVAAMQAKQTPEKPDPKSMSKEPGAQPQPSPAKRERERGNASAVARMVQRDLGLAPKSPRTSRNAPFSTAASKTDPSPAEKATEPPTGPKSTTSNPATSTAAPPAGPRNTRPPAPTPTPVSTSSTKSTPTAPKPSPAPAPAPSRPSKPLPQPSPNAKSAFLKHANPSQGVTEDLLRSVFATFGTVTRCEIDKKKGLGYIDFDNPDALRAAMHASPVKVGSGQVVVLENRNQNQGRNKTQVGGGGGARAGGETVASNATATSAASTGAGNTPTTVTATATSPITNTSTPTATGAQSNMPPNSPTLSITAPTVPTAPRAASRGSSRGNTRGNASAPRGATPAGAPRGAARGGFRGGRGGGGGGFGGQGRGGGGGGRGGGSGSASARGGATTGTGAETAAATGAAEASHAGGDGK